MAESDTGETKTIEQQAVSRLAACRVWKSYIELDLKEMYYFAAPNRQRQISSMVQPSQSRMLDAPDLNTDQAFILVQDFITELVNAYMPEANPWCERGPGMFLKPEVWDQIKDKIAIQDRQIFAAMKASNLYPEVTKAFYPDIATGTCGLWIDRPHISAPVTVQAIPLRELEFDLGPYGEPDTRFAVRYTRNHYVREIIGEEIWDKMPADSKQSLDDKPGQRTQVIFGFWRIWKDRSDVCWQHTVMLRNKLIHDAVLKGEGSCPMIVGRFNPTADWPHGHGPLYQGLPTLRQIDELEIMRTEHSALSFKPPITYPDDSFVNVDQGIEEGMAYPIRPGTEGAVKPIYQPPPVNVGNYTYEEKLHSLRKLFFVDFPEQRGDTPPTLGQWLDEMARAQRRIGTPGLPFWREICAPIFQRFQHLLEIAGTLPPIKVDGRAIALMPRNPAQAAAEQQEVGMAVKALQIIAGTWPEEFKMFVDGEKTMKWIVEKMRVTGISFRNKDQVQAVVGQIAQLAGARHVGQPPNVTPGPAA